MTIRAVVKGVGHYLPERVVPNADLETLVETTDEWIRTRSGIERRHYAAEGQTTSDLGTRAAQAALADAGLTAQVTMGGADAEATKIYAEAFNKDKDFYGFYRRMEAYKQAFGSGGSTMILSPDTDFFRYFTDPAGLASPKK